MATPFANNQEYFDHVYKHFSKPGVPLGKNKNNGCSYRNEQGFGCAIGCAIPDELYSDTLNRIGYWDHILEIAETGDPDDVWTLESQPVVAFFANISNDLLVACQSKHDEIARRSYENTVDHFLLALKDIAARFNLTVPSNG